MFFATNNLPDLFFSISIVLLHNLQIKNIQ